MELAELHTKNVVCCLPCHTKHVVIGKATLVLESDLGEVLRIRLFDSADDGCPELLIQASEWEGRILRDEWYGCDYVLEFQTSDT